MTEQVRVPGPTPSPTESPLVAWQSIEAMQQIVVMRRKDPELAKFILDRTERTLRHHMHLDWFDRALRSAALLGLGGVAVLAWRLISYGAYLQALGVFAAGSIAVSAVASGRSIVQIFIRSPKSS
jgi:hypothetical protein